MYEERKTKIPFRDIALQILIVILFVLVLLWLFPTKKNVNKYVDNNSKNNNTQENGTNNTSNDNNNINNGENGTSENGVNKDTKKDDKNNTDNKTNDKVMYEYVKEEAGTYGEYGAWSDWTTNYVAASDTVEVQTDVRRVATGTNTYQQQVGTKVTNEVIGNVKNNKVLSGYKVNYVRTLTSSLRLDVVDEYIYILVDGVQKYDCDSNIYEFNIKSDGSMVLPTQISVEDIMKIKNNFNDSYISETLKSCSNPKLYYESYNYKLYKKEPVYTSTSKDVYGDVETPILETKTNEIYSDVTYYRYRTRKYTAGAKDIKWSYSDNDQTLLNQGYKLTGNKK